jgi:hypothetical protein
VDDVTFLEVKNLRYDITGDSLALSPRSVAISYTIKEGFITGIGAEQALAVPDLALGAVKLLPTGAACNHDPMLSGIDSFSAEELVDSLTAHADLFTNNVHRFEVDNIVFDDCVNLLPAGYFHSSLVSFAG